MESTTIWAPYESPFDPRQVGSVTVYEDKHGRLIETADCGERCPGCGLCCAGYRDVVEADYAGVEEFAPNLRPGRGGLVEMEGEILYRSVRCEKDCPGYGRCCPPLELREHPNSTADARRILLERNDAWRYEMEEALIGLAHAGTPEAVQVLEAYARHAHARLEGFVECALDEGRYFASCPRNESEARIQMKEKVRDHWEERCVDAYGEIQEEIEPELERQRYEYEITQRLLAKAASKEERDEWEIQASVMHDVVVMTEAQLEEKEAEAALCEAMIAEIEADLAQERETEPDTTVRTAEGFWETEEESATTA